MDLTFIVLTIVDVCVPHIAVICNFDEAQFELHVLKGQNVRASPAVHQGTWAAAGQWKRDHNYTCVIMLMHHPPYHPKVSF